MSLPFRVVFVLGLCFSVLGSRAEVAITPQSPMEVVIEKVAGDPSFYQHKDAIIDGAISSENELYQCQWYGEVAWAVRGLDPSRGYRLVLGNAETSSEIPDYRMFDVLIDGDVVRENVNLYREFGFSRKADLTFPVKSKAASVRFELKIGKANVPRASFLRVLDDEGKVVAQWSALSLRTKDDLALQGLGVSAKALTSTATVPPWPGSYKQRPGSPTLTAADMPGPDGLVYPDWRMAGVPGGIPSISAGVDAADFGALPDDDKDDREALGAASRKVAADGGGVVRLAPGTYHLDRPLFIDGDGVVLRGAGMEATRIEFRYGEPADGVDFFMPKGGATIGLGAWIEMHARPEGLNELIILANGKQIARQWKEYPQHWGGTYALRTRGKAVADAVGGKAGPVELTALARYDDGTERKKVISVTVNPESNRWEITPTHIGAITFVGAGRQGSQIPLAVDGLRGDLSLTLAADHGLKAGDKIMIRGPATERWKKLTTNAAKWGDYRDNQLEVLAVVGNQVWINQPLRIEFPTIDGSFVQRIKPIVGCGVEDLTLEQTKPLWTNGIHFSWGWGCWVKGVHVIKAGRFPIYTIPGKFCEIRDSKITDAWYNGGGGTAYVGWEASFDCLMENMRTVGMRHAPNVQWGASGNVIRNSLFDGSDGQWHSGWTNENLFENCTIISTTGDGGYGFGLWASPPEDEAHGPNGPRNVVYNCDVQSPKASVWLGGMNENWIIVYNRFVAENGPGVVLKNASFDHIIRGNVFRLNNVKGAAMLLLTADCIGIEIEGNQIFGTTELSSGRAKPAIDRDNVLEAVPRDAPKPDVVSIFEWQRKKSEP